uniref:G protein-coupled receptor n=1 Tax=Panagrellus redivivus TaxID=6233 RepID=A0A7E4URX6_PANRE
MSATFGITSCGFIFILVNITATVAHDQIVDNQTIDFEYRKMLEKHPNVFTIDEINTEALSWILILGVYASCSRIIIGVPALLLYRRHKRTVSNSTLGLIRVMERLNYLQTVIIFLFVMFPGWLLAMLLFVFNDLKYASELFMLVVLVLTLSPIALAVSTLWAMKPYHVMVIEIVTMLRLKFKPT